MNSGQGVQSCHVADVSVADFTTPAVVTCTKSQLQQPYFFRLQQQLQTNHDSVHSP